MTHLWMCAAIIVASGCGLISSDVTNFDLTLPDKKFSIDAASWDVAEADVAALLATSCADSPNVCSSAARQACRTGCSGVCNASTQTCDLALDVNIYQTIDLVNEAPELKALNDEPVVKVTIDSVTWQITSNTLSVDTPVMTVFVAPASVMDPNDAQTKVIGTIDPIAAGTVTEAPQELTFTATGRADLIAMMSTFKTPFNVLVGSTLLVTQGDTIPTGKLDAVVKIRAHAGL
jgi:hypothetical protein